MAAPTVVTLAVGVRLAARMHPVLGGRGSTLGLTPVARLALAALHQAVAHLVLAVPRQALARLVLAVPHQAAARLALAAVHLVVLAVNLPTLLEPHTALVTKCQLEVTITSAKWPDGVLPAAHTRQELAGHGLTPGLSSACPLVYK